jgi:aldehyde:ferredoxin oxidoreductase
MTWGFCGVDLTSEKVTTEERDERYYRKWIGGSGLISHILLTEVPAGAVCLGPDNKLVFALSPVTGTPSTQAAATAYGAKSPFERRYCPLPSPASTGAPNSRRRLRRSHRRGKAEKRSTSRQRFRGTIRGAGALWGLYDEGDTGCRKGRAWR